MTQINNHVILSHIDTPIRILFWPASHVAICTIPIGIGMVVDNLMIGFCMSFVTVYCLKKINKIFGRGRLRSILYWHLPTSKNLIAKGLPPSYVRYWIR